MGRRRRGAALAAGAAALALTLGLATAGPAQAQDEDDPITDLPFISGSLQVLCGWHRSCAEPRAAGDGIDLGMGPGSLVVAGGQGAVSRAQLSNEGYGYQVWMDHEGGWQSIYGHLSYVFPGGPMANACRYVALGYSGNSGRSVQPHLHFEGRPGKLTPVYGSRAAGRRYADGDFEPALARPATAWVGHDCGPRGGLDCRGQTKALTVDEVQATSSPRLCRSCEQDEFRLAPWGGGRWEHWPGGFGYGGLGSARHFEVPLQGDGVHSHWAYWMPWLNQVDSAWAIYVFIPQVPDRLAEDAQYYVKHYGDMDGRQSYADYITLPQRELARSAATRNGWVRLGTKTYRSYWANGPENPDPPLIVGLSNRPAGRCAPASRCAGRKVAADALMFLPSQCEPGP